MALVTAPVRALARACLAASFVILGYDAARAPGPRVDRAARLGVPEPELAVRANGAGMVLLGTTMALGIRPRLSALGLAAMLVPTTLAGHPFWEHEGGERAAQRIQFLKNVGLFGGLAAVIGSAPRRRRRAPDDADS